MGTGERAISTAGPRPTSPTDNDVQVRADMPTGQKLDKLYKLHSRVYGLEASKTAGAKPKANAKPVATITKARGLRRSSRISGTATRPRGHLQNLPTEIIVHILEYLSAQDIALFRTVCCAFRDIVNESVALQYTIERSLAGVVEGSLSANDNLKDRLAAVREWRQAWRTLRWTDRRHAREVPEFGMSQVSGSVYTIIASSSASPDGAALEFRRLGSKLRGVPPKEWSLDELPDHESFAVEYEEDLLVLAEM
ncbi:uncharacterized protein PHACADRAFT_175530 [Phanerochaete carnosa HHB-10118-sp]|uniref:F-box domain-containing protein n=1 Tax=Phanerochaete carnosa (strain HHB-10118-sp) TaxID=650164 RepID=K5UT41_PHACS|nr:uncharacterized protein PHACADRAFT_175530 [Phanerochaete carnosa HHB-10118-sp]EKM53121.1 hypothetical protein PHACADRAFT_175530 [Phanerochaete carnosa HHB-10118-sp]